MSLTTRDSVLGALKSQLQTILTTGGYRTNAGQRVYVWRAAPFQVSELPAINVRDERNEQIQELSSGQADQFLQVRISGLSAPGADQGSNLRSILADMLEAIGTDRTLGGYALDTTYISDEFQVEQEQDKVGSTELVVSVHYRTNSFSGT